MSKDKELKSEELENVTGGVLQGQAGSGLEGNPTSVTPSSSGGRIAAATDRR